MRFNKFQILILHPKKHIFNEKVPFFSAYKVKNIL